MTKKKFLKEYLKTAFKEKEPYVFISYSHAPEDVEKVYNLLIQLMKCGINFVFDVEYGYKGGSWVPLMKSRIESVNCKCMLSCYSDNYVYSRPSLIEQFYRYSTVVKFSHGKKALPSFPIEMQKTYGFKQDVIDSIRERMNRPAQEDNFDYSLSDKEKECFDEGIEGYEKENKSLIEKEIEYFNAFLKYIKKGGRDVDDQDIDYTRRGFQEYIISLHEDIDSIKKYVQDQDIIDILIDDYKVACLDEIKLFAKENCHLIDEEKEQLESEIINTLSGKDKDDIEDTVEVLRNIGNTSMLKELLLGEECNDTNLKNLISDNKIQIRISDSISFHESYLNYNTWLFSFDKKEPDADKWDFFILKKGELQDDGKLECFDATNLAVSVQIKNSISKTHFENVKKVSLQELLDGVYTECFVKTEQTEALTEADSQFSENIVNTKKKSASVTGDITYTLYGKEYTDNQANMMFRVFAQVLKRHPDKIATLPEQSGMNCAMKYEDIKNPGESSAYPTYFRSCRNFTFENGESVCIGTAYSSGDKMKKIARLLEICEEDRTVFQSEQIELPEVKVSKATVEGKRATSGNGIHYSVYGEALYGDQTDMMTTICSKIIERHPDKLQAVVDGTLCAGYKNADTMAKTYFRVYREFTCNGTEYVIGTSFGLPGKIKEIEKVLSICGEDASNFDIEGVELNVAPSVRKGRTKVNTDNFLDD